MRAMVLEKPLPVEEFPLRLSEIAAPHPAPNEVRVRVRCCGRPLAPLGFADRRAPFSR